MKGFYIILCLSPFITATFACNGYSLENFKTADCQGDGKLFTFDDFSVTLPENCIVNGKGYIKIHRNIKECDVTYTLTKKSMPPIKVNGKKKLCPTLEDSKQNSDVRTVLNGLDLKECPINKRDIDGSKAAVDLTKHKDKMALLKGDVEGEIKGKCTTDEGTVDICKTLSFTLKGGSSDSKSKMFPG